MGGLLYPAPPVVEVQELGGSHRTTCIYNFLDYSAGVVPVKPRPTIRRPTMQASPQPPCVPCGGLRGHADVRAARRAPVARGAVSPRDGGGPGGAGLHDPGLLVGGGAGARGDTGDGRPARGQAVRLLVACEIQGAVMSMYSIYMSPKEPYRGNLSNIFAKHVVTLPYVGCRAVGSVRGVDRLVRVCHQPKPVRHCPACSDRCTTLARNHSESSPEVEPRRGILVLT